MKRRVQGKSGGTRSSDCSRASRSPAEREGDAEDFRIMEHQVGRDLSRSFGGSRPASQHRGKSKLCRFGVRAKCNLFSWTAWTRIAAIS